MGGWTAGKEFFTPFIVVLLILISTGLQRGAPVVHGLVDIQ